MSGTFFRVNIASTYLAMFVAASCVSAQSEPSHGICMPGAVHRGFELVNQGRQWNAWSNRDRSIYLIGFVDGQSHTFVSIQNDLSVERRDRLRKETFTFYDTSALLDVMTSLYADPANTYIAYTSLVYIARDKLAGKDVQVLLRNARQNDCTFTEVGK